MLVISQGLDFFLRGAPWGLGRLYSCWLSPLAAPTEVLPSPYNAYTPPTGAPHHGGHREGVNTQFSLPPDLYTPEGTNVPVLCIQTCSAVRPPLPEALPASSSHLCSPNMLFPWTSQLALSHRDNPLLSQAESSRPPPVPPASVPRDQGLESEAEQSTWCEAELRRQPPLTHRPPATALCPAGVGAEARGCEPPAFGWHMGGP